MSITRTVPATVLPQAVSTTKVLRVNKCLKMVLVEEGRISISCDALAPGESLRIDIFL